MRFKKMMRGIALLLMTVLLSVSVCPLVSHADKISDLKKSIQDKQDAIDKAQNEKKALQSGLTDVKKVISGLQTSKQNLSNYISQLDDSLSQAQARILELNTMITDKEAEITKTAAELEDAIARYGIQDQVEVDFNAQYVMLNMNGALLFDSGHAEIRSEAYPLIDKLGKLIEPYQDNIIEVEGHTDNVPIHSAKYEDNDVLSF